MRGSDERSGKLFSYVDLEQRMPARHPLRAIRAIVNEALADIGAEFEAVYSCIGRPSIAPEKLLRALLLQLFHGNGEPPRAGGRCRDHPGVGARRAAGRAGDDRRRGR